MEPQKIEYPKDIAINVSNKEGKDFISFLKIKNYDISYCSGIFDSNDVTYSIKNKEINTCLSYINADVTYEEFKELISTIDIVNTGDFVIEVEDNEDYRETNKLTLFSKLRGWKMSI